MGHHFWGYEVDDFVPDIVTMGKPMGNGHPLAGTVTRRDLIDDFAEHSSYFNTFGGNPVSCAAGLAVLEVIETEKLQENALTVGLYLNERLAELALRHDMIGDIRGDGLFKVVEIVSDRDERTAAPELNRKVVNGLRHKRVLAGITGTHENCLKLRPPMVFSKENADEFAGILDDVLKETEKEMT